jgi:hypothetical protein
MRRSAFTEIDGPTVSAAIRVGRLTDYYQE